MNNRVVITSDNAEMKGKNPADGQPLVDGSRDLENAIFPPIERKMSRKSFLPTFGAALLGMLLGSEVGAQRRRRPSDPVRPPNPRQKETPPSREANRNSSGDSTRTEGDPESKKHERPRTVKKRSPIKVGSPVDGMAIITCRSGRRKRFRTKNGALSSGDHGGPDIVSKNGKVHPIGQAILAAYGHAKRGKGLGGFGNIAVCIHTYDTGEAGFISLYAHLKNSKTSRHAAKSVGSRVDHDDVIGDIGETGNATGPHLHLGLLEVKRNGRGEPYFQRVTPERYLRGGGFSGTGELPVVAHPLSREEIQECLEGFQRKVGRLRFNTGGEGDWMFDPINHAAFNKNFVGNNFTPRKAQGEGLGGGAQPTFVNQLMEEVGFELESYWEAAKSPNTYGEAQFEEEPAPRRPGPKREEDSSPSGEKFFDKMGEVLQPRKPKQKN
jgi:murein DD-endopeptidase MepM/ murein hydrolase activator NlpD